MEELNLINCKNLSETGVISLFNKIGEELKKLYLGGTNLSLSNAGLITSRFSKLEELSLSNCKNLSETGVISLFNKIGEGLKILDLGGTNLSLSDAHLITTSFKRLEELDLGMCKNLSEIGVISLLNKSGDRLRYVLIAGSYRVSAKVIKAQFPRVAQTCAV